MRNIIFVSYYNILFHFLFRCDVSGKELLKRTARRIQHKNLLREFFFWQIFVVSCITTSFRHSHVKVISIHSGRDLRLLFGWNARLTFLTIVAFLVCAT